MIRGSNWIGVRPGLARVYMTALAEEMGSAIGARPVVDNATDHVSISGLTLERLIELLLGPDEGRSGARGGGPSGELLLRRAPSVSCLIKTLK